MNILLADDDRFLRETLEDFLSELGHEIISARHGREALKLFKSTKNCIDLMITDICMPHLDGVELSEQIRLINPLLPIIIITGFAKPETIRKARHMDVQLLHKPIDMRKLVSHVDGLAINKNS